MSVRDTSELEFLGLAALRILGSPRTTVVHLLHGVGKQRTLPADEAFLVPVDATEDQELPPLPIGNQIHVSQDPLEFLQDFEGPIDLLVLDGWPVGEWEYQERHLQAYLAARDKLHEKSLILIGDTDRDHGGKGGLVVPQAVEDGFDILVWGEMTLLSRVPLGEVEHLLPPGGTPVPVVATYQDAIELRGTTGTGPVVDILGREVHDGGSPRERTR